MSWKVPSLTTSETVMDEHAGRNYGWPIVKHV